MNNVDRIKVELTVSIWHDAREEPKPNMELICVGQYGNPLVLSSNSDSFKSRDISKWAYFNDLLNLSNVQRTVKNWKEEPVSEELEKEVDEYILDNFDDAEGRVYVLQCARYFANWQKAQLLAGDAMKEVKGSFGGEIKVDLYAKLDNGGYIDFDPGMKLNPACGVQIGNRVRIIVMED